MQSKCIIFLFNTYTLILSQTVPPVQYEAFTPQKKYLSPQVEAVAGKTFLPTPVKYISASGKSGIKTKKAVRENQHKYGKSGY